ncbi:MAG TPA: DNA translocase FtsK 4TM domain-containing protein, partial [Chthoniobacterales bacterium]
MNRFRKTNPWKEVIGIGLILLGVLLFVALISFDKGDLPGWAPLIYSTSQQNEPLHNLVGVVGALLAGYSYFLLGAAAYWLALIVVGFGIGKLLVENFQLLIRCGWGVVNL